MLPFFRTLFWLAVAATLFATLRTITHTVPGSDKTQHAVTFGTLMLLAACAYPRVRPGQLALALSALGAAIELIQPWFGRSDDVRDWLADSLGIGGVLVAVIAFRAVQARRKPVT